MFAVDRMHVEPLLQSSLKSIKDAENIMEATQKRITKMQSSKENSNKLVAQGNKIVESLLEPAQHVANLLDGLGGLFGPCKLASNILAVSSMSISLIIH